MQAHRVSWWFRKSLPARLHSLPARLALFAIIFIASVAPARLLALDRLLHVQEVSGEVRNRWLDSISVLYQVGRRSSDLGAAEADVVLITDPAGNDEIQLPTAARLREQPDPFFTVAGARAYGQDIPSAETQLLQGGHFALEEFAPEIAKLMLDFLDRRVFPTRRPVNTPRSTDALRRRWASTGRQTCYWPF